MNSIYLIFVVISKMLIDIMFFFLDDIVHIGYVNNIVYYYNLYQ